MTLELINASLKSIYSLASMKYETVVVSELENSLNFYSQQENYGSFALGFFTENNSEFFVPTTKVFKEFKLISSETISTTLKTYSLDKLKKQDSSQIKSFAKKDLGDSDYILVKDGRAFQVNQTSIIEFQVGNSRGFDSYLTFNIKPVLKLLPKIKVRKEPLKFTQVGDTLVILSSIGYVYVSNLKLAGYESKITALETLSSLDFSNCNRQIIGNSGYYIIKDESTDSSFTSYTYHKQ